MKILRRFDRTIERYEPASYGVLLLAAVVCAGFVRFGWVGAPVGLAASLALFGYAVYGFLWPRKA
ncbi:putative membrane protein [Burkholderia gladioli]|uniref:Membrane protein n=1 Tax=Burkholderia gladioli TaxID=28095 RepID=A0AAW3FAA1_BURGA|nr:putative membrane protein [Burkholderia gladioli]